MAENPDLSEGREDIMSGGSQADAAEISYDSAEQLKHDGSEGEGEDISEEGDVLVSPFVENDVQMDELHEDPVGDEFRLEDPIDEKDNVKSEKMEDEAVVEQGPLAPEREEDADDDYRPVTVPIKPRRRGRAPKPKVGGSRPVPGKCLWPGCELCARGPPPSFLSKRTPSWVEVARLSVFCLMKASGGSTKRFFHIRSDIFRFIEAHWDVLCKNKTRTATWGNTISAEFHRNTPAIFKSGLAARWGKGYWALAYPRLDPWTNYEIEIGIRGRSDSSPSPQPERSASPPPPPRAPPPTTGRQRVPTIPFSPSAVAMAQRAAKRARVRESYDGDTKRQRTKKDAVKEAKLKEHLAQDQPAFDAYPKSDFHIPNPPTSPPVPESPRVRLAHHRLGAVGVNVGNALMTPPHLGSRQLGQTKTNVIVVDRLGREIRRLKSEITDAKAREKVTQELVAALNSEVRTLGTRLEQSEELSTKKESEAAKLGEELATEKRRNQELQQNLLQLQLRLHGSTKEEEKEGEVEGEKEEGEVEGGEEEKGEEKEEEKKEEEEKGEQPV